MFGMKFAALRRGLLACASLCMTPMAQAQDPPLWELGLGLGALQLPDYRGSDQSHTWWLPVPYVIYRGSFFKADREGARAVLVDTERTELNLSVAASPPTRSRGNRAREGMADLAPTLEFGPNLNSRLAQGAGWQLDLRLPVRAAFAFDAGVRDIGWVASPHLNLDRELAGWRLGLQAGPVFGDRRFHRYFYEVPPSAATDTRPAYRAAGGYGGAQALAALSRRQGNCWVGLFAKFDTLSGAAMADSPLVRDRQQWSAGIAVAWVLARSPDTVPAPTRTDP
jgi:MipA family protein